jgi:hypothetical protein
MPLRLEELLELPKVIEDWMYILVGLTVKFIPVFPPFDTSPK